MFAPSWQNNLRTLEIVLVRLPDRITEIIGVNGRAATLLNDTLPVLRDNVP